jgi:hypothetical protein
MSGTIVIRDDADWMPAGWVFNNVLELVASELRNKNLSLSMAFLDARTDVSVGYLDLRTLEAEEFRSLMQAVERAYNRIVEGGASTFQNPSFYEGFIKHFADLKALLEADVRAKKGAS